MSSPLRPDRGRPLIPTRSWNPVTGCTHLCSYCWAMRLIETKLRDSPKYRAGFRPTLHREDLERASFSPRDVVFVVDMGDLFSDGVPDEWIREVLRRARQFPSTKFLFLTKNPGRYFDFLGEMPPNAYLGATIETNRDDLARSVSRAPPPSARARAMIELPWPRKYVSIEPIMDFDLDVMVGWLREISPVTVHIGYDNWNSRLPEPPLWKARRLVEEASKITHITLGSLREAWYERAWRQRYGGYA